MSKTLQPRYGPTTRYGRGRGRRRRRVLLGAVLALFLASTAFAASRHLLNGGDRSYVVSHEDRSSLFGGQDRSSPSTDGWPLRGQGAYVLKHEPLRAGESGRRFVIGQGDVVDTEARRREGQSVVDVRAGEQLSERDALMAILLPSANNVAVLVARQVSGSVPSFVAEMNHTLAPPAGAYRRHIENRIRAGNTTLR